MQKLQVKLKNTPRNTFLVPCSVSSGLNKEEIPSDQSIVRTCNNSEENLQRHRAGSDSRVLNTVYVLNKRGRALMPTCPSMARRLICDSKAKIVKRYPFTIQLTIASGENRQEIVLGVDVGYQKVGISALSSKQELLSAEICLRNNITKLISDRSMYQRNRRNRLWYRKPRFNNRVKPKGWLAPSVQQKVDSHVKIIEIISKLLPITKVIVETAKFDIQKIKNPDISGKKYQDGEQKDFWNIRAYVFYRDNHTCQYCKRKNLILQVHHIVSRKTGGDRPGNLITLCVECHNKCHKGKIKSRFKATKCFKPETCMSIIRKYIINELKKHYDVEETFGYITKSKRIENKIDKTHVNDAFVIANGNHQVRNSQFSVIQKRKNNRSLQKNRKGFAPSIRRQRYKIQPQDLVKIKGKWETTQGMHCKGTRLLVNKKSINIKLVEGVINTGTLNWKVKTKGAIPPTTKVVSLLAQLS